MSGQADDNVCECTGEARSVLFEAINWILDSSQAQVFMRVDDDAALCTDSSMVGQAKYRRFRLRLKDCPRQPRAPYISGVPQTKTCCIKGNHELDQLRSQHPRLLIDSRSGVVCRPSSLFGYWRR